MSAFFSKAFAPTIISISLALSFAAEAKPRKQLRAAPPTTLNPNLKPGECIPATQLQGRLDAAGLKVVATLSTPADLDFLPDWVQENPRAVDLIDSAMMIAVNEKGDGWRLTLKDPHIKSQKLAQTYRKSADPAQQKKHLERGLCMVPDMPVVAVERFDLGSYVPVPNNSASEVRRAKRACGVEYKKSCLPFSEHIATEQRNGYNNVLQGKIPGDKGNDVEFQILVHPADKDAVIIYRRPSGESRAEDMEEFTNSDPALLAPRI